MFFKKKKEELSDQLAVFQERKSPRLGAPKYNIDGGITITGFHGEGQIGNISATGCSMKSVTYVNIKPDDVYQVRIIPGKEYKIEPFNLRLKLSWTKSSEAVFLAGFSLEGSEGSSHLKRYFDQLRLRGFEPDYGNIRPDSNQ